MGTAAAGSSAAAAKGKAELHLAARRPAERLLRAWGGADRVTLEHTKEAINKCLQVQLDCESGICWELNLGS